VMDEPEKCTAEDEECMGALEETMDLVEDINMATEFDLMDGPAKALNLIAKTTDPEVRRFAAMIIAQSSQNHQRVQQKFTELKFQDRLIPLLATETAGATRAAIIFAISCLCRGFPPASAAFLGAGGLGVILTTITLHAYNDPKTTTRCFRLAEYFAVDLATTAAPVAAAACRLAVAEVADSAADGRSAAKPGPSLDVTSAAAGCASAIVNRCLEAGKPGVPLAGECVTILAPWMETAAAAGATDAAPSPDHKELVEAFRAALKKGVAADASGNKAGPSDLGAEDMHLGAPAPAAQPPQPMLALPAPKQK